MASKIEELLGDKKGANGNKPEPGQTLPLKTELEIAIEGHDTATAKRLIRSDAEVQIAENLARVKEINKSQVTPENQPETPPEKKGNWLIVNGQIIKDTEEGYMTFSQAIQALAAQSPGAKLGWTVLNGKVFKDPDGDMTLKEAIQVAELNHKEEGDPEIKALLKALAQKEIDSKDAQIKAIADGQKTIIEHLNNPGKNGVAQSRTILKVNPDGTTEEVEAGKPIIIQPVQSEGKSVALVAEENRHNERLLELGNKKEHDSKLADSVGDLVEVLPLAINEGLAGRGMPRKEIKAVAKTTQPETITCSKCGTTFAVPPGEKIVKCPGTKDGQPCPAIYEDK